MKRVLLTMLVAAGAGASFGAPAFDRYQVILDRKPFGEAASLAPNTAAAGADEKPADPGQSFALGLRVCSLIDVEGVGPRVGLVDMKGNRSFFVGGGEESDDGIKLVSANLETEEVILQKGAEMAMLKVQAGAAPGVAGAKPTSGDSHRHNHGSSPIPPPTPPVPMNMGTARMVIPSAEPKLKGEELEKHLRDYQMEVIRQGLPPLPIPLTQEMDQKLVNEGVLPAQQ